MICPVCSGTDFTPFLKMPAYKICSKCTLYRQDPLPPKMFEGPQENFGQGPGTGHQMPEDDKAKNKALAEALYSLFQPGSILDIGTKYPYLLSCLKDRCSVLGVDGIEKVLQYGQELGVPTRKVDIEAHYQDLGRFDLITLIHLVEHLYNPVETLRKVLESLTDRGVLYIRTTDPEVPGIERNLTDHHLTIHPHLFTRKSLEMTLAGFGYEIFRHDRLEGFGQSDYYIHKNLRGVEQKISLCMIVKNEEKNVTDCLESIYKYVDEIIIVDTGSQDRTKEVVSKYTDKIYDFKWIDDFSAARNFALTKCTMPFVLWCDADDVFQNPQLIRSAIKEPYDAFNFNILYGNDIFCHAKMFRNFSGVHFKGKVHEYPVLHWLPFKIKTDLNVLHKTAKHVSEDRTMRNYRILEKEVAEEPTNSRALFYLANSMRELGKYEEAITTYHRYLKMSFWKDERFMAQKYIGQIRLWQKHHKESIDEFLRAIMIDDRWAEAYYYIGENYFLMGRYDMCILWMHMAMSIPVPDSTLFKEMIIYRDMPYRYIFACYETLGNFEEAYEYCKLALEKNPSDQWLKDRLEFFKQRKDRIIIECYRQGARGDIIMTTAALRGLKEKYPDCFIRYVTHQSNVEVIAGNKYVDEVTTGGKSDATRRVYFAYPEKEGYPHKPLDRHLIKIFNECAGLPDNSLNLEVTLSEEEDSFGRQFAKEQDIGKYVTLQMQAGWSPYKEWFDDRWHAVVEHLFCEGIPVVQLGGPSDRVLNNTINMLGLPLKRSLALVKYSHIHLGVDSVLSHAANAFGIRLIELFGSTSPVGSGYGDFIWKGLDCSPCYREYEWAKDPIGPCPFNKKCMDMISVEEVIKILRTIEPPK